MAPIRKVKFGNGNEKPKRRISNVILPLFEKKGRVTILKLLSCIALTVVGFIYFWLNIFKEKNTRL